MMSHYTLYDVISYHDVTWIALECYSCDFCVAVGGIPTLIEKNKIRNKYIFVSYILAWNDLKRLNSGL